MRPSLVLAPLLTVLVAAPAAHGGTRAPAVPVAPGIVEHTLEALTLEREGVVERDERIERWVSARRAKVVYTDAVTGETLGACSATRRRIRCFDRDPALEVDETGDGGLFQSWADSGAPIRRALARGWLRSAGLLRHRGVPVRRLVTTAAATGDTGETTILAQRGTLAVLFRQTRSPAAIGTLTSTEDVLKRERLPLGRVDFRLRPPPGARVRSMAVGP